MILATAALLSAVSQSSVRASGLEYPGQMFIVDKGVRSIMPLERTAVTADVAGMGARVTVRQTFANPSRTPIEALYTFPLPEDAAVDRMRIRIGQRTIEGSIMRREAARKVYDAAKANGQTAALLDQETDNIFTQSVANVMPGQKVEVEISYVQIVKFDSGEFQFVYPMVVGPRFLGEGTPNPGKISPPTLPPGVRSGANVSLTVNLRGGAPLKECRSVLHQVRTTRLDAQNVRVELAQKDEIPNRDFILKYRTTTNDVQEATFATWDAKKGGHFAIVLAPPPEPPATLRSAKEMVFVVDQSGSQGGFPIEKSKELALALMKTMGPGDSFNVMGFSNEVNPLWPAARPNTPENRQEAEDFVKGLQANGGTELEKAIVASLSPSPDPERLRIVLFNTDGYAGQESVILNNVQKYRGSARMFTYGIGNSVNRALIEAMSSEGRGAAEYVTLADAAEPAKNRLEKRLEAPLLVDVKTSFPAGISQVTPANLPDVFSAKPVVIYGRYSKPGETSFTVSGMSGGRPWRRTVTVDLPATVGDGSSVASLWARAELAEMKSHGYAERALGRKAENTEAMTQLALDYGIMSETTSFVAVDKVVSNSSGKTTTVVTPVEMPDGVTMGLRLQPGSAGGGFGGGLAASSGAPGTAFRRGAAKVNSLATAGFPAVTYSSANNSIVVDKSEEAVDRSERGVEIEKGLLKTKGRFAVRVTIEAVSQARIAQLKKAGLKVESHDGSTLVFGMTSAKQIRELAKLPFVRRIARLHPIG